MAGSKNLMTGLLVLVVVGVLVYLVDPTFFGLLKAKAGFQVPVPTCEEDPEQEGCSEGFEDAPKCPAGSSWNGEECVSDEVQRAGVVGFLLEDIVHFREACGAAAALLADVADGIPELEVLRIQFHGLPIALQCFGVSAEFFED